MSGDTAIDVMYENAVTIGKALEARSEVSLQVVVSENFRKILLLASASYFEQQICGAVLNFVRERSNGSELITNFVKNKAVARQYHTWFNWSDNNANQFFGLFGPEFRAEMISKIKASDDLRKSVEAFLELGNERNKLIHQDYATFPLEKTLDEIYELYRKASIFVQHLSEWLRTSDKAAAS